MARKIAIKKKTRKKGRKTPKPAHPEGIVAHIVVCETVGATAEKCEGAWTLERQRNAGGKTSRAKAQPVGRAAATISDTFSSLGHPVRVRILTKLLAGPVTYKALQRATQAKPGPLYHHVNQLRLSGLVLPKQRDLYELTRGGRNMIVGALALSRIVRDSRRRQGTP